MSTFQAGTLFIACVSIAVYGMAKSKTSNDFSKKKKKVSLLPTMSWTCRLSDALVLAKAANMM